MNSHHESTDIPSAPGATPEKAAPAGDLNVHLVVDHPEIVMVENPLNLDTNALILNVS